MLLMGWDNNTSKSSLMLNVYKNEQELEVPTLVNLRLLPKSYVTGFYGRLYLLPRSQCNSSVRLEVSVMQRNVIVVSAKSKQKRRSM